MTRAEPAGVIANRGLDEYHEFTSKGTLNAFRSASKVKIRFLQLSRVAIRCGPILWFKPATQLYS